MTLMAFAVLLTALGGLALLLLILALRGFHARAFWRTRVHAIARARSDKHGILAGRAPGEDAGPLLDRRQTRFQAWLQENFRWFEWLEERLMMAGLAVNPAVVLLVLAVCVCVLALLLLALGVEMAIALLLAMGAPWLLLRAGLAVVVRRRRKRFLDLLPDALGLMVRGLRAGVPISETIIEVGREVPDPVGGVFRHAGEQLRLGQPLESALLAATRGLDLKPMHFLVVTLSIQRETGGNLAETLDNLAIILGKREQMLLKIKGMSAEARASAFIIGALPVGMVFVMWALAPEYIAPLFFTDAGRILLCIAILCLGFGSWLMAQMVRFEPG